MSRDYDQLPTDGRQGIGFRTLLVIAIIAFIGGIILTGWLATHYDLFAQGERDVSRISDGSPAAISEEIQPAQQETAQDNASARGRGNGLTMRVAELENRLSRINVQAQAASGNAARAEGLLVAFATRRAIEQGRPLGYLDQQLQVRFGRAQPDAVRTIRAFAANPVRLEQLQSRLDEVGDQLRTGSNAGFFGEVSREFSELFLIRKQGTPSTSSAAQLRRAQRFAATGNVQAAISEVEKLPGAGVAQRWVADAKRYQAAQDALEAMEMSAIFEPGALRDAYGEQVDQPSPLRPEGDLPESEASPAADGQSETGQEARQTPRRSAPAGANAEEDENFFGF